MDEVKKAEFGFKPYAVPRIVKAFFENFREFDAIDANNKLRFLSPISTPQSEVKKEIPPIKEEIVVTKKPIIHDGLHEQSIPLTDGQMATLYYPKWKMKEKDFEALEMFIKLIKLTEGVNEKSPE